TCVFFKKLPLELRERIYKCLLVNPDLSAARYLKAWRQQAVQDKDRGTPYKFGLSPQILRVCRQAHNEAKPILYHHNIFVIELVTKDVGYALRSPVFRFPNKEAAQQHRPSKSKFLQEYYPWVTNVKHWKIILTANLEDKPHAPDDSFTYFCRHLCFNKPRSLEVLLLPKGGAFKGPRWTVFAPRGFHHPKEVLQPLTMLRNIASLKIGEVERSDLPFRVDPSQPLVSNNIPQELKVSLKTLVEGDTPVKYVFMMYEKLLEYAQAFERHPRFKAEMSPVWGLARRNRNQRAKLVYSSREHNPFKQDPFHPVEMNLELASIASEANDADAFKQARSAVLEYLEPQYQRIVAQAAAMAEFVKDENRHRGRGWPSLFQGSDYPPERDLITTCIMYLEDYAATFVRDVPSYTKFYIRKEKEEFDFAYSTLEREMTMAMLYNIQALRSMVYATREWRKWFKDVVDDMDKQYLEIRKARKALLDFDADDDCGCDIDLELWRCDEMINWGTTEPNLHPLHLPTADELHEYVDDSDDFGDSDDFDDGDDGDDVETGEAGEAGGVVKTGETGEAAEDIQAPEAAETGEIEAEPENTEVPNVWRIICPGPHGS
ncbi:hypothetical protein F5882DRAFT_302853, partial [Hyaloscypha sp. PMI_1271]